MERVVFADSWQSIFVEFGLSSFDDLFRFSGGKQINKNNKRDVNLLSFDIAAESKVFFIKRFHRPHFKDMLFTLRNFGRFVSQARAEWENTKLLFCNDIETYRPVCYGEQTRFGLESKSFIITEKLQGYALTDFVGQKWQFLKNEQKEKIIVGLAHFVRRIHNLNVSLPDLYLWHIFIKENPGLGEWEFAVIDLHRMARNVTNQNQQIRNLGALDHSMLDKYFDDTIRRLFIESYAGRDWPGGVTKLAAKVKKRSRAISARRNQKEY